LARSWGAKRPKCKCHRNKKLWEKHTHLPFSSIPG